MDWEDYRMNVAKDCMTAMIREMFDVRTGETDIKIAAQWAVRCADALINELKCEGKCNE